MSTTLATLRQLVRDAANLTAGDPAFPDNTISRQINMAMQRLAAAQPNGWWFLQGEVTQQNTSGADQSTVYVDPASAFAGSVRTVKVFSVFCSTDGNYWQPVPQLERSDQVSATGGAVQSENEIPEGWRPVNLPVANASDGSAVGVQFEPPLPDGYWVRAIVQWQPLDFLADSDAMLFPDQADDLLVEMAAAPLLRQRRVFSHSVRYRSSLSQLAETVAAESTVALRRFYDRPFIGPGFGSTEPSLP